MNELSNKISFYTPPQNNYNEILNQALIFPYTPEPNEEMFDVLDENGLPVGHILPRSICHKFGLYHRAIAGWIINPDNKILIQKRSMSKEKGAGLWDISFAGHVSAGQNSISAASREINEEISIGLVRDVSSVRDFTFKASFRHHLKQNDVIDNQFYEIFTLYITEKSVAQLSFQKEEVEEIKFVDLATLREMLNEKTPDGNRIFVDRPKILFDILENTIFNY